MSNLSEPKVYSTRLLSGETVNLTVQYGEKMESKSDTLEKAKSRRAEVQRLRIPQPMASSPEDTWKPPQPRDFQGQRIQVTAHVNEHGQIVERWQFSENDVRWYRLEINGKAIVPAAKPSGEAGT